MKVKCTHCGRERIYNPSDKTILTDLRKRKVQCFYCGKSFGVVPKI